MMSYDEFGRGYKLHLIEHNYDYMVQLAGAFGMRSIPNGAMIGNGEVWVCFDMNVRTESSFYFQGNLSKGTRC